MALFESPEEEAIRRRAEARQAEYEAATGEKVPEEPGIEPDRITEGAVDMVAGGPINSMGRRLFATAARGAGKSALSKLKDKGAPPAEGRDLSSAYKPYQPMKQTQATTGFEPGAGIKVIDSKGVQPWIPPGSGKKK